MLVESVVLLALVEQDFSRVQKEEGDVFAVEPQSLESIPRIHWLSVALTRAKAARLTCLQLSHRYLEFPSKILREHDSFPDPIAVL